MHAHPLDARMAHLEGAFTQMNERLAGIDRRLDSVERRFDSRFDQLDRRFAWLTGLVFGSWITTILAVVLHH